MSNIIEEALKIAVVDAFFNQKHYVDNSGYTHTYGGQLTSVIEKILPMLNLGEITALIINEIDTNPDIKQKMANMVIQNFPSLFNNTNHWNNTHEKSKVTIQEAISQILLNSEDFKSNVLNRVNLEDKNIQISVTISDKKGKN